MIAKHLAALDDLAEYILSVVEYMHTLNAQGNIRAAVRQIARLRPMLTEYQHRVTCVNRRTTNDTRRALGIETKLKLLCPEDLLEHNHERAKDIEEKLNARP